jgi:hypothetical protein
MTAQTSSGCEERLQVALRELAFHAESCALPSASDMQRELTQMSVARARKLLDDIENERGVARVAEMGKAFGALFDSILREKR